MNNIRTSFKLSLWAFLIMIIVFLAVVSPLKGLSVLTFPLILLSVGLWLGGLLLLFIGLFSLKREVYKKWTLGGSIILAIAFVPIGFQLMGISGSVRTKITIEVANQLPTTLNNVMIYGTGDLFPETDTLKVDEMLQGQKIVYNIWPDTKPQKGGGKKGNVKMVFDANGHQFTKIIAGEFSVYPFQQEWEVVIDETFLE